MSFEDRKEYSRIDPTLSSVEIERIAQRVAITGVVYCIANVNRPVVKIGWSMDAISRLAQLQTASPDRLRLAAFVPGSKDVERGLHDLFADIRLVGEWFHDPEGEIVAVVSELYRSFKAKEIGL